ncbi:MAG: FAD-dependent oxidoreductase [Oscillospiraceae bacterium]|nr:FAD-dependent oxidoreductase [Oscillospiraceae bacterium]
MQTILYAGRQIPLREKFDVIIVGAGTSGSAAAISCAKLGLRTLAVERSAHMGGTAVNALVCPMMPSHVQHLQLFGEIEARLQKMGRTTRDGFSKSLMFAPTDLSFVLEELYTEAGGEILFDAVLTDAVCENGHICYILVMTAEGLIALEADSFIDATGDAVLSRLAGAPVSSGDENGNNQISSLRFIMGNIDVEAYRAYCRSVGDDFSPTVQKDGGPLETAMVGGRNFKLEPLFQKAVEDGVLQPDDLRYYQNFTLPGRPGCMAFNCPHLVGMPVNTSAEARSKALIDGRKRIRRLTAFLQKYMPGFEKAFLIEEASMLGIRESWRLRGRYILTEEDFLARARFPDGLVRGDWYIDVHSAGKNLIHKKAYTPGEYYEIPYRSMICPQIENLAVTGRCISATFLMQASVRIIPTCIDMGEALGYACRHAKDMALPLNRLDGRDFRQL